MVYITSGVSGVFYEEIIEGQLQWFINVVSYLQFATGETMSTA